MALAGRVLDSAGKPVPGALVRVRSQTRGSGGEIWRVDPVVFGEDDVLHTDKDGRYQTPLGVPAGREYQAAVTIPNATPGRSGWKKTVQGSSATLADVVLHRITAIEGIVHDRAGRPVPGARVFQSGDGPMRTRTISGEDGHFRLPGVIAGKAILFASKVGFRFHGQPIDAEVKEIVLTLTRNEEQPEALKTLSGVLARPEELALARRLLAPYIEKAVAKGTDVQKLQALIALAPVDAARTLELVDSHSAGKPQFAVDMLHSLVAAAIASQSPDEAVSIAESINDPAARSGCLTRIADRLPASSRDRKVDLLAQAQLQARSIKQPGQRISLIVGVAERWLDLGEKERAKGLFDEGRALPKDVAPPGYEITAFAQGLARTDLPAALALIDQAKALAQRGDRVNRVFVFDRAYGEIAYRLAASDPPGAERALGLIADSNRRGGYVVAACGRMAVVDLARAGRLAESIEDPLIRAYALGQMSRALASVDRPAAIRLLDDAFNRLDHNRDERQGYSAPDCVAAALLRVVESVDPARLQESVWHAVSLREPWLDERGDGSPGRSAAELAMNLARYDRKAAAAVLDRAIEAYAKTGIDTNRQGFLTMALALIDPARVVAVVESLPEDVGLDRSLAKNSARLQAAEILAKQGEERWQAARSCAVSLWTPEGSDL